MSSGLGFTGGPAEYEAALAKPASGGPRARKAHDVSNSRSAAARATLLAEGGGGNGSYRFERVPYEYDGPGMTNTTSHEVGNVVYYSLADPGRYYKDAWRSFIARSGHCWDYMVLESGHDDGGDVTIRCWGTEEGSSHESQITRMGWKNLVTGEDEERVPDLFLADNPTAIDNITVYGLYDSAQWKSNNNFESVDTMQSRLFNNHKFAMDPPDKGKWVRTRANKIEFHFQGQMTKNFVVLLAQSHLIHPAFNYRFPGHSWFDVDHRLVPADGDYWDEARLHQTYLRDPQGFDSYLSFRKMARTMQSTAKLGALLDGYGGLSLHFVRKAVFARMQRPWLDAGGSWAQGMPDLLGAELKEPILAVDEGRIFPWSLGLVYRGKAAVFPRPRASSSPAVVASFLSFGLASAFLHFSHAVFPSLAV